MTRLEFNAAMERILVFYQRPTSPDAIEDFRLYMDGLYGVLYAMDGGLFGQTCLELTKSLARGQKPMPSQFWAVYHKLSEELARKVSTPAPKMSHGENHLWLIEMAKGLKPVGAAFVLEQVGKGRLTYPQDVLDILEDIVHPVPIVVLESTEPVFLGSSAA